MSEGQMSRHYVTEQDSLQGYDALRPHNPPNSIDILLEAARSYPDHFSYLDHEVYNKYLHIHKVFVGNSGGRELQAIAQSLDQEILPRFLDAAGWSYAESALVQDEVPHTVRSDLVDHAQSSWERALYAQGAIVQSGVEEMIKDTTSFRLALNLAYTPILHALVDGDVTEQVIEKTYADVLAISQLSIVQRELALREGNMGAVGDFLGFEHECNAMLAILYLKDVRYIPLPSSSRADSGYFHSEQAHDIIVLNQHWGKIKKVIPMEVKARASMRDKKHYNALIVRGKMHLSVTGKHDPIHTLNAFGAVYEGQASNDDIAMVEHATVTIKDLLRLYQKGEQRSETKRLKTVTKFYNVARVAEFYRELAV
jgi:hypothetical protein